MPYNSLKEFVQVLDGERELGRITGQTINVDGGQHMY